MGVVYLENHTVDFTPELWEFCQQFKFETTMIPLILDPVYKVIEFRQIPSPLVHKLVAKWSRVDRTHVRMLMDAYFTPKVRNGRTAGWRTTLMMDMEADINTEAGTYGDFFDLKGNIMPQGHIRIDDHPGMAADISDLTQWCLNAFTFIQQVLKFKPEDLELHEEELPVKEVKKSTHNKKGKPKQNQVASTRTYKSYRLRRDYDFTERNPIVRQCRLWYVRGHDRHLSDGRTIKIDPYYKGVDRAFARPEDGDFGRQIKVRPPTNKEESAHA